MQKEVPWIEKFKGKESVSQGKVEAELFNKYYDESNTIDIAGPIDPNDADSNVYNQERVYEALGQRRAKQIMVINDQPVGGNTLFVRASHSDPNTFSPERPIFPQETKIYFNIYELRLRSALQGHAYRVMEYILVKP
jgi:hypothetical protein